MSDPFWSALATYRAAFARWIDPRGPYDEDDLARKSDAMSKAAVALLKIPARGSDQALALLEIAHNRTWGPARDCEPGAADHLDVTDDLMHDYEGIDRAFLEAGIRALARAQA